MHNEIAVRIRNAVSAGEFAKASALWQTYGEQVAAEIRSGTCPESRLPQIRELIEWSRGVITCAKAHAQHSMNTRLKEIHAAAVYGRTLR